MLLQGETPRKVSIWLPVVPGVGANRSASVALRDDPPRVIGERTAHAALRDTAPTESGTEALLARIRPGRGPVQSAQPDRVLHQRLPAAARIAAMTNVWDLLTAHHPLDDRLDFGLPRQQRSLSQ